MQRCLPLSFIANSNSSSNQQAPSSCCPCCLKVATDGLYLLPLSFEDLEESVRLRKNEALKKGNNKRARDDEDLDVEARYLVYSQGRHTLSSTLSDIDNARTGRWTHEEVAFVDHVVQAFDNGQLPLSHGVKLSTFLGDILLCRPSRLTKKMKNAKLSTRSFDFSLAQSGSKRVLGKEEYQVLSALQDRFIGSMQSKVAQLELKFNLVKQWRTYFSNLCVQIGYPNLDAADYIASLEEMERRASKIEDQMRVVRRQRMGLGTKSIRGQSSLEATSSGPTLPVPAYSYTDQTTSVSSDIVSSAVIRTRKRSFSEDLDNAFMSLYDANATKELVTFEDQEMTMITKPSRQPVSSSDPFLEAISRYMERSALPFQHADVWVPSFVTGNDEDVQLLHAGHVTRKDQVGGVLTSFNNFGEYSKSFTFQPNQGLPGRVYSSGQAQWEFQLYDPSQFPRSQGAKAYGLRTATAIPISTPGVGRMVVVFYSSSKLQEDSVLVNRCAMELSSYSPAPRWKLCIEIGNTRAEHLSNASVQSSPSLDAVPGGEEENTDSVLDKTLQKIITIMGNEIPSVTTPAGESTSSSSELLPHFMAIRLLLLRSSANRSAEENDIVEILKGSYTSYSQGGKRSDNELACLLAREWVCLKSNITSNSLAAPSEDQPLNLSPHLTYTSHQLMPLFSAGTAATGMTGPPTILPNPAQKSRGHGSVHPALRRTVSCSGIQLQEEV